MKTKYPPIAKISRPTTSGVVTRTRVVSLLDVARNQPIIWVSAPAGSGKTTLVTSYLDEHKLPCLWYQVDENDADIATFFYYMGLAAKRASPRNRASLPLLTPEYLQGITTFTRRYFDSLYGRFSQPFTLVFDNYQTVPADSDFHGIIRDGLSAIPDGINVIVISREPPPPVFARLRASNRLSFIGWDEIRFDLEETKSLILSKRQDSLPDAFLEDLHKKTEGWAAGVVLMLERMKSGENDPEVLHHCTREEVFHYFAGELFEKAGRETQDFLLASALLPSMTAEEAQGLTGNNASAAILAALNRNHFFTERHFSAHSVYQYHPLFREFLLARAEDTLPPAQLLELRRNTAALLERSGRPEPAAELMCKIGDWPALTRLINTCAQAFIAQGRTRTLEGWLRSFPEGYGEHFPWLEYWLGACRLPFSPLESQHHFERAFELFGKENNPSGQFLAWAGKADSIYYAWSDFTSLDRWFVLFDELLQRQPVFPSVEIEVIVSNSVFGALLYRNPVHAKLVFWEARLDALLHTITDSRLRITMGSNLINYYVWVGDFAKAARLIDTLRASVHARDIPPLVLLMWNGMVAIFHWEVCNFEGCRKTVAESLKTAETMGIHILDMILLSHGTYGALSAGELSSGADLLDQIKSLMSYARWVDIAHYHYLAGWEAALREDIPRALDHAQVSLSITEKSGVLFPQALSHAAMAQLLITLKQYNEASRSILMARRIGHGMKSSIIETMCLLAEARLALDQNDEIKCLVTLREAFALGKSQGHVNYPWWQPKVMARLCAKALEAGIEAEYVQQLVRKRHLLPPASQMTLENWPWPLKIYTLSRFELVRDGEPVRFSGKVQQKPLALLKALIAFGGADVAEEQVTDVLWPDVDGDLAHRSFEVTVHRLRKLIGHEKAIQLQDRRLTLDISLCWVDVRALGILLEKADAAWKSINESPICLAEAVRLSEKAVAMYRGHFLPGDSAHSWVLSTRERLRSKFLRLIVKLGTHREQAKQWESAAEVFQKGLEVDGLAEEFYQHLMVCYQQVGRRSEAIAVYNRCRSLLSSTLGIVPSTETENLYQSLKNGR
ncbi:MAG: transcriptional activator domain-containing [Geobacteraceae bacterium]|nr:MAG: transcriptional activator domain-containing [Geobacteraceae bacterium]